MNATIMSPAFQSHTSWLHQLRPSGRVALLCILLLVLAAWFGPLLLGLDPYALSEVRLASPSLHHAVLGTDDLGRDVLARLLFGARTSLAIAGAVVAASLSLGAFLGLAAGVYSGWIDLLITRIVDALMTLPSILLAVAVAATLGPGLLNAGLALTAVALPRFARLARSVAAGEMRKVYVQAARSCGASRWRILWSEVLPNCRAPLIVQAALGTSDAVLEIAALGFLGLGVTPPSAEWGTALADARPFIESAPYLVLFPGLCILFVVLSFNVLGDALQDLLDPKRVGHHGPQR